MQHNKIFCIGLNKTGTSSLHEAFKILNYKSIHRIGKEGNIKIIIHQNYINGNKLLKGIENYDAYSDWNNANTNFLFKKLDEQYPKSKFVLNTRDIDGWLNSREKHVKSIPELRNKQAENPENTWYNIDKKAWVKDYREHHRQVLNYFEDREDDLLIFNLFDGDSWEKICDFLNRPVPKEPFPYANKSPNYIFKYYKKIKKIINLK